MHSEAFHPHIVTERLSLRPAMDSDIPAIIRYYQDNALHFAPTDPPRVAGFYTADFWAQSLRRSREEASAGRYLKLYVFPKDHAAEVLGHVEFSQIARGPFQACYLGYGITQACEGKGLMHEALEASIRHAFDTMNLHRIMANHLPENARSARVLRRLGFTVEAVARDYLFINGAWRDHVLNVLIHHAWRNTLTVADGSAQGVIDQSDRRENAGME